MNLNEHPNPQIQRNFFRLLNGIWEFELGKAEGKYDCPLSGKIEVPYCPESVLSGIGNTDFITDCAYSRVVSLREEDLSERLVLHFGAVDYAAAVYVNGRYVGGHLGGYTAFEFDIAPFCRAGENRITVFVHDNVHENTPSGKQSPQSQPFGCYYTRTTGIWQSVWLEKTPKIYLRDVKFFPKPEACRVGVELYLAGEEDREVQIEVEVSYEGKIVGRLDAVQKTGRGKYEVPLSEKHLWEVGDGKLYDVKIRCGTDEVISYFGLRSVRFEGYRFLLNGKSVFQRLVLDQGYYPQGVYTAPDESDFSRDISLATDLGFNGARLHQKVFDPRYLYECDRAGFLVWGEFPSWGIDYSSLDALGRFLGEWTEAVEQQFNHPSIITWCPLNEVWGGNKIDLRFVESVYLLTKTLDSTRPCVDCSGGCHGRYTDLYDDHCYVESQTLQAIADGYLSETKRLTGKLLPQNATAGNAYDGILPVQISEYGGVVFVAQKTDESGWGYQVADSEEEFVAGYEARTSALLSCPVMSGFCYTQLYDVEQEQNGLYTYERKLKFSKKAQERIRACNQGLAKIEEEGRER